PRTFIDLNEREQQHVIRDLRKPTAAVPHIRVSYRAAGTNTTDDNAIRLPDSVTVLDFVRYVEALGLEVRLPTGNAYSGDCADISDIRNTRLKYIPIIWSRGDPQVTHSIMKAFVQPRSIIISTDPDFARANECLGLVQKGSCIDESDYCIGLKNWPDVRDFDD